MRRPRPALLALGGLAGVLLLIILAELIISPVEIAVPEAEPAKATEVAAAAPAPLAESRPDPTPALLARPLFNPTRRPESAPTAPTPVGETSSDLPRLAGILVSGGTRIAIFQPGGDEKPIWVGEGEEVKGWTVQQIAANAVTVDGPGGTQTIEPKFDPNAPTETAAAEPTQPPMPTPGPAAGQRPPGPNQQPNGPLVNRRMGRPGRQPGILPQLPPNLRRGPLPRPQGNR